MGDVIGALGKLSQMFIPMHNVCALRVAVVDNKDMWVVHDVTWIAGVAEMMYPRQAIRNS